MSFPSSDGISAERPPARAEAKLAVGSRRLWAYLLLVYLSLATVSSLILLLVATDAKYGAAALPAILASLSIIFVIPFVSFGMKAKRFQQVILSSDGDISYRKSDDHSVRQVVCSVSDVIDVKQVLENIVKITYRKNSRRYTESLCLESGGAAKRFIESLRSARESR